MHELANTNRILEDIRHLLQHVLMNQERADGKISEEDQIVLNSQILQSKRILKRMRALNSLTPAK